jgi:predicted nucleic-acid-binding protein
MLLYWKFITKEVFSENHIDPGDISEELKELSEIEKMLIAQVFMIMSVYWLWEGQNWYRENIINFSQDVQKFTDQLSQHPLSLDILVVQ